MASSNASVVALKQLSTMKKDDDAVHLLSGRGCTWNLREYGKHNKLSIRFVAMKPQMHSMIVNFNSLFCHDPKARRW